MCNYHENLYFLLWTKEEKEYKNKEDNLGSLEHNKELEETHNDTETDLWTYLKTLYIIKEREPSKQNLSLSMLDMILKDKKNQRRFIQAWTSNP